MNSSLVARPTETDGTPVVLQVGHSVFETSTEELQAQDDNSYFHICFSGRWSGYVGDDGTPLKIEERSGRLFSHILYYLRFGDIPRSGGTRLSLLDSETMLALKAEAEFFLLPRLVSLCDDPTPPPMFVVTKFSIISSNQVEMVLVSQFETYQQAKVHFEAMVAKNLRGEENNRVYVLGVDDDSIPFQERRTTPNASY